MKLINKKIAEKNPEIVEHFGITVVEAMSAGAIPVVFNAGGHKEIIKDGVNGFLWESTDQLIKITNHILKDRSVYSSVSKKAKRDSSAFSFERFEKEIISSIL